MTTLEEVARLAAVSPSTVSRALARPDMVAQETRDRVLEAVRQTGYRPNALARSLRQQESRNLGLVITDLNPFHATLAKGVQDAAEQYDLNVILFTSDESERKERRALETLRSHMPQGLILIPTAHTRGHQALLQGLPVVELDRVSGISEVHSVQVDNVGSARSAVQHLIELGHRRIGGIFGHQTVSTATGRLQGYQDALREAMIPFDPALVQFGDYREASGHEAALHLLSLPANIRPTALFVSSHEMTVGAVLAMRELGVRIPHDVSVVGFDDSRLMQILEPPMTVIAQPTYDLGQTACHTLVSLVRRRAKASTVGAATESGKKVLLPAPLIVRRSTSPPRNVTILPSLKLQT
ncbi:LacI family DNA-binding transcriptional regulator [Deinococcus sp. S9]|uniref:LacI family DNA-binding transcriptional regulator n=1 Tax=Deinococcus sp. S9 TaxID=2545754 RepID=UPI001055176C|nr:LacI family DNA-binding transcriptional regulator [Deinococcus sp. S9]TDE84623.1 LacI family transcriptional regulator [Deinococcus sp. S9]